MLKIKLNSQRDEHLIGNLTSFHSFSYASQIQPEWMSFYSLKVFSECFLKPNEQFNHSLSYTFFKLIPIEGQLDILCRSHGKSSLDLYSPLELNRSQAESVSFKNNSHKISRFFLLESNLPIEVEIISIEKGNSLTLDSINMPLWCHLIEGHLEMVYHRDILALESSSGFSLEANNEVHLKSLEDTKAILCRVPIS
ncbi:MAG: hypothetical protein CME65_16150 [Halobacteriovoraceae bacterium]|nr:hypothetical protein [Halobacteriovoraceae bacterium]|tara:strand:+ start:148 stop:735 length:588 start_codon:yes stop_codon:yes gene_type:complete